MADNLVQSGQGAGLYFRMPRFDSNQYGQSEGTANFLPVRRGRPAQGWNLLATSIYPLVPRVVRHAISVPADG